jgi:hypothetical protein
MDTNRKPFAAQQPERIRLSGQIKRKLRASRYFVSDNRSIGGRRRILGVAGVCTRECFAVVADISFPVEVRFGLNRATGHDALKSRPAMPQVMAGM